MRWIGESSEGVIAWMSKHDRKSSVKFSKMSEGFLG
uniref:Uncharacterized protein n=1 Tax=Utricularia reniformis TaxID=192314 RepID=A0A1Y0B1G6_9LAMI|nr:hypothetical protein AEK19_MT1070 [Utricularia reniformis]ART31292.1 hypothetical protein AEK19_MT1070 [Utricularia reniformis]